MAEVSGAVMLTIDPEDMKQIHDWLQRRLFETRTVVDPNPMSEEIIEWQAEDGLHTQQLLSIRRANVLTIVHGATGRVDFHPNLDRITPDDVRAVRRMLKAQQKWLKRQLAMMERPEP